MYARTMKRTATHDIVMDVARDEQDMGNRRVWMVRDLPL